ncbi:MAG TPA: UPF0280 family protein [Stellaceae bacterium]|nr:UPF0280 family protein [Stellaceae bacterium]
MISARLLPDGKRLHLQQGPIDLVIEAWGEMAEVRVAYRQAAAAFETVLSDLVAELPLLRTALTDGRPAARGPVARRMIEACWPYRKDFITPMAAVAGSVADHILAAMLSGRTLAKAYVNDGGDIAIHLAEGERLACGMVANLHAPAIAGTIDLISAMPVRGIATSGAPTKGSGGRSFSFGIADAVTVLARSGAAADAAATIIANAVDLPGDARVRRVPASELDPDSDLGSRLVTVAVPALEADDIKRALWAGLAVAEELRGRDLIHGAVLALQGRFALAGAVAQDLLAA